MCPKCGYSDGIGPDKSKPDFAGVLNLQCWRCGKRWRAFPMFDGSY